MYADEIHETLFGENKRTFVIAEAGSNHNGNIETAKELVDVAAAAGADAVKFQTFKAENVYVENSGQAEYLDDTRSLFEIIKDLESPFDWIPELHDYAREQGIWFLSTPGGKESADALEPYVPLYKVESFNMSNYPLIDYLAEAGKPLIISTGAHGFDEVLSAAERFQKHGLDDIVLLQCVSGYPTPPEQINVGVLEQYQDAFSYPVGLSDHTMDPTTAPAAAVALGGCVVEKHFTLDRSMEGPDHSFALEPDELNEMVTAIRQTETVLGDGRKKIEAAETELTQKARRFIQATADIEKGERLTEDNIGIVGPGEREPGLEPKHYEELLGRTATEFIKKSHGISWNNVSGNPADN
jgi:N-acetylneuraminate synthase